MNTDADLEMILADLGSLFIEDCREKLDLIDFYIDQISDRIGSHDHHVMDIKSVVHTIKCSAGGYGFSAIVDIAHAFEDYIDLADTQSRIPVDECRAFSDAIRFVIIKKGSLNDKQASNIVEGLPLPGRGEGQRGVNLKGHIIFVLPKSLQQKIISRELASFGFRITNADDVVEAIEFSLNLKPDLVITTLNLKGGSGPELASALSSFASLSHTRIAVLTPYDAKQIEQMEQPKNTTLIAKGASLAAQLLTFIRASGFV
jgi:CheY-like chemotaxis protein